MNSLCSILVASFLMTLPCVAQESGHSHHEKGDHEVPKHRFDDAQRWAKVFEDPSRDEWQRPKSVLDALDLEAGDVVADLGSGTGYFAVRLAPRVERVWAVDIEPEMIRWLNARAREEGIGNLYSILGVADDPLLPEPVDLVLIVDTYHHIHDRSDYFNRLKAHLKPGGEVAIVDFLPGDLPLGPPAKHKLSAAQVEAEFTEAGYSRIPTEVDLPYQYVLRFTPVVMED